MPTRSILRRTGRTFPALALVATLAAGCSSPLEPVDLTGTYVLARTESGAMPTPTVRGAIEYTLLRSEVDLRADGSALTYHRTQERHVVTDAIVTRESVVAWHYEIEGRNIVLRGSGCTISTTVCIAVQVQQTFIWTGGFLIGGERGGDRGYFVPAESQRPESIG